MWIIWLVSAFLTLPAAAQKSDKQLTVYATVSNKKGEAVSDINAEKIRLFEEGKEKKILSLSNENEPLSIGFLLDTSGSMSGVWRHNIKGKPLLLQGLADLIDNSNKDNEYFIVTFGKELHVLQNSTKDHYELGKALNKVAGFNPRGNTKLFDAVYSALKKMSLAGYRKKALIVVSDAEDNNSLYNYTELRRAINDSNTLLYFVRISRGSDKVIFRTAGELLAEELAKASGGIAYNVVPENPKDDELGPSDAFSLLTQELQNQYAVTFESAPADGKNKWRELSIKLNLSKEEEKARGKLSVRTRNGYYSLSDESLSEK
jgi:VWFA-related protein